MTLDDLVQKLSQALGPQIRSVILYGSAAAGDHIGRRSDYNVLVVTERLGIAELQAASKPSAAWRRAGNPMPLFFTLDRLQRSADVFPIELLDMQESHRVLYGDDVLQDVEVHTRNLRLIVERELKSCLIRLREGFLQTRGKPREVLDLLVDSLSTVLVLCRAALRLYQTTAPPRKMDALKALREWKAFDDAVFMEIEVIKEGDRAAAGDPLALFERYLGAVEALVDAVDSEGRPPAAGTAAL